jgi:hypothetical protein
MLGRVSGRHYGNSNFDIPNAFKGYASYELPFGEGKRYLSNGTVMNEIVGGWRIAGTFVHQSGTPFTVIDTNNLNSTFTGCGLGGGLGASATATGGDVTNGCNWYLNVVGKPGSGSCAPTTSGGNGGSGPTGTTSCWFNTSAFAAPSAPTPTDPTALFQFGNEGRNSLRGQRRRCSSSERAA